MKCFEYFLKRKDIVAVLPTGFVKSLLLFPAWKADNNIENGFTGLHDFNGS